MTVYRSKYPCPAIPLHLSVSQFLNICNPDDTPDGKIIFEDDWTSRKVSYGALRRDAARCAHFLRHSLGIKAGDVVAICALNSVDHIQLIHSVIWTGATAALVSPYSTPEEVVHCFDICRPKIVAVDDDTQSNVQAALGKVSNAPTLMSLSRRYSISKTLHRVPDMFNGESELPVFDLSFKDNREATAFICFSSGTSGKPKGVELSHHSIIASLSGIRSTDPTFYNSETRCVFFAPLCHIYGLNSAALMGAWLGNYTMMMRKYSLDGLLELSAKIRADTLRIVPPIALAMSKSGSVGDPRLDNVRFIMCSGATLQPSIISFLQERFPKAPIFQGYGMTETNIATLRPHQAGRVGSVGKLFANVEARLVDEDLNDVRPGEEGEMLVRGPTVFRRYMRNPEATSEAFHEGWMRTGDVLRCDSEGFLYLTGRKKELIKYKGFQVAPAELEAVLITHPFVEECAVCGAWDEGGQTEVPVAYIKLSEAGRNSKTSAASEVAKMVNSQVSSYKRLRGGVIVLDELPKTASGKLLKRLLPATRIWQEKARL